MLSSTAKNKSEDIIDSKLLYRLGSFLKGVREKKLLTLNDIRDLTCIHVQHLDCIENGRREHLPEDVFLIGFIKKYSKALNLKDELIFNELSSYIRTKNEDGFDSLFSNRTNSKVVKIKTRQKTFGNIYVFALLFLLSTAGYVVFKEFRKITNDQNKFSHVLVDKDIKPVFKEPETNINLNEVENWAQEEEVTGVARKETLHNISKTKNVPVSKISSSPKIQKIQRTAKPKPVLTSKIVVKPIPLRAAITHNKTTVQQFKRIMID